MIPDADFASSWPTDANGNSLGPITSSEGTSIAAPQNGSGKYYWFADVQQYASGDNRYSDQWVPANIIDGASSGVKGSVPSSKADYVANSGTQSMGNSIADAFFHSTDAQQAWDSSLDKLGSLVETSTLTSLMPLAVSGKSLSDAILNCSDQSTGACLTNVSINTAFTLIGGFSTASQAKMFDAYSSVDATAVSAESNATIEANSGSGTYVDILSPEARQHILYGDGPGSGGHLWPGQSGKTVFPENWSADKVIHDVGDIATSPDTTWYAQTGTGGLYTKNGDPAKWVAYEVRDGVQIRVVYQPATGKVVTAFPDPNPVPSSLKPVK